MSISEKDKRLMERADEAKSIDWGMVMSLADEAEDDDVKDYLLRRGKSLYHLDEYYGDLL